MDIKDLQDAQLVTPTSGGFNLYSKPSSAPKTDISQLSNAQGNLSTSQALLEKANNVFTSPLHNIAAGNGADNLQSAIGAGKQAISDFASAGAQNAGPIGQGMLDAAPGLKPAFEGLKTATQPTNLAQAQGAAQTGMAEVALGGPGGVGLAKEAMGAAPGLAREAGIAVPGTLLGNIADKVGEGIQGVGKSLYKFFLPQSEKESALLRMYKANTPLPERIATALKGEESGAPKTMADSLFDKTKGGGTEGALGVKATRGKDAVWKEVLQPAFKEADKTHKVSMTSFFDELQHDITVDNPEPSRRNDLLNGLEALKEDYKGTDLVSPSKLQDFKEAWAQHLPNKAFKGQEVGPAFNEVKNLAADKARTGLYDLLGPDAKEAFFDYGNLKSFEKLADQETSGKNNKSLFSLETLKNKALVPIATVAGRTVYRVGQGIELVGEAGARTLGDLALFKSLTSQETQPGATPPQPL